MTAFAQAADLNAYTGGSIPDAQANAVLGMCSDVIRAYTRRQIDYVTNDEYIDQSGQNIFVLPEMPVVNVSSVQVLSADGVTWVTLDPTKAPIPDYVVDLKSGTIRINYVGFAVDKGYQVKVTYDHGYQTIPDTLKQVCLIIAARMAANPYGLWRQQTGSVDIQFQRSATGVPSPLTEVEKVMLGRFTTWDVS